MSEQVERRKNSTEKKKFTITKKIAKHGSQSIIVIPRILESQLKPGTVVQLDIDVLESLNNASGGEK